MPNTPYYIRLSRTFTMTGKPGDQPPFVVRLQSGIRRTRQMDLPPSDHLPSVMAMVAPSSSELPNTSYYALVTTDYYERPVVDFPVSSGTATRTFSIKVENH
jgi:hypothetical protein